MRIHTFLSEQKHAKHCEDEAWLSTARPAPRDAAVPSWWYHGVSSQQGRAVCWGQRGCWLWDPRVHIPLHVSSTHQGCAACGQPPPCAGCTQDVPGAASPLCQELSEQNTEILSIPKESSRLPPFLDSSCDKHATVPPASPRACALPAEPH